MDNKAFIGYKEGNHKLELPLKNLRKHFLALGSSGSGKTVLSKVILEEAAMNNVPIIAVDPQGDIASLLLAGDEKELEKQGISKDMIEKFKNLNVTVFTPLSSKGVPICLNPLDIGKLEKEELIPLIHQLSSSITKLIGYLPNDKGKFAETIIYTILKKYHEKKRPIKSFSQLADFISSMDDDVREELKDFITSEKDIEELIRKIRYLTVGEKELLFNLGMPLNIDSLLGKGNSKTQISVIYLNTLTSQDEKEFFVSILTSKLYQWMLQNPSEDLSCLYFIDEIAPFIPAGSEKPIPKPILTLLFKQARKYGVGCITATQNPGDIDYKAFSQFGSWAIGRLTLQQDQKKVEKALRSQPNWKGGISKLPSLKPGNFLLFSPDYSDKVTEFRSRWLVSQHKTLTEIEIKKLTTEEKRKPYSKLLIEPDKTADPDVQEQETGGGSFEKSDSKNGTVKKTVKKTAQTGVKHFKIKVTEQKLHSLIERMKKRYFLIGPKKEELVDFDLYLRPVYKIKLANNKKGLFGKKTQVQQIIFVDAKTCEIIVHYEGSFKRIPFNFMIGKNENSVKVLQFLSRKKEKFFPGQIALKTKIGKASITSILKNYVKEGTLSYEKEGKDVSYYTSKAMPPKDSSKVASEEGEYSNEEIQAKKEKADYTSAQIEKALNLWFEDSIVVENEVLYLPVYKLTLSTNKESRKEIINSVTGSSILSEAVKS